MEKKQNKKVNIVLQEKDLKILEFLAKFGIANEGHIMKLIDIDEASISMYTRIMRRLILTGYVEKKRLIANEYAYVLLGQRGAELLTTTRLKNLVLNTLKHDMLTLDLYFDLVAKNSEYQIMSERELRIATGFKVGNKKKIPDLLVDDKIAIEVELSEKSNACLIEIINNYIRDTSLEEVHYFVKSKALGHKILDLAGQHKKLKVFLLNIDGDNLTYRDMSSDTVPSYKFAISNSFDLSRYFKK